MFKKFLVFLSLALIFVPGLVSATDSVAPELNPLCWTSKECADQRKIEAKSANIDLTDVEAMAGFVAGEGVCKGKNSNDLLWGKCLAGGQANTEIGIGGVKKFKNIGEYIKTVYNYLLGIASIVAVVMLIIAGAQWIVAAGSSEVIGQAKKRISGALIGLVLAWSSYLILNTINPWLTNFRLPQTWMIKQVELMPEFCGDIKTAGLKFAPLVGDKKFSDLASGDFKYDITKDAKSLLCGNIFAPSNGGGATCLGDYCPGNYACLPNLDNANDPNAVKYKCLPAIAGGKVSNSSAIAGSWLQCLPGAGNSGWTYPWITSGSKLIPVCDNGAGAKPVVDVSGTMLTIRDYNQNNGISAYLVNLLGSQTSQQLADSLGAQCVGHNYEFLGFAFYIELDKNCVPFDRKHLIGAGGVDLGYFQSDVFVPTHSITESDLIPSSTLAKGLRMNIDVYNINPNN